MAENFPAYFLENSGEHHARVRGVPEIVEPEVAYLRPAQARRPRGLDDLDGIAAIGEDDATFLAMSEKHGVKAVCEWNLPRFPFRRFRVGDMEDAIVEIDVLPSLAQDLSPAHSGMECASDDPLQVLGCGRKKQLLLAQTHHRALGSAFPFHVQPAYGVRGKKAFLDSPIENTAQDTEIAIDGGGGERLLFVTPLPILSDSRYIDVQERHIREERQQIIQPVERVRLCHAACNKMRGEFSERHVRLQLRQPLTRIVQLIMELPFNGFQIGRA